jgi:hypothetical protein
LAQHLTLNQAISRFESEAIHQLSQIENRRITNGQAGRRKRFQLRISGRTEDGRLVIGNAFPFVETKGVLLGVIVKVLDDNGWIMDWVDFIQQSLDHGWKPKGTLSKVRESLADAKGVEYADEVMARMERLLVEIERGLEYNR